MLWYVLMFYWLLLVIDLPMAICFILFIILPEKVVKTDDNGQREENYDDDQLNSKHNSML